MKINEKTVANFAVSSSPVDREGYLHKRGELNKGFQRRWFVLKGNLLFYFEKKQDKEPFGVIVIENCGVQASPVEGNTFEIVFDGPGCRTYVLQADSEDDMLAWMKSIAHASYEYLKTIVTELQRQLDALVAEKREVDEKPSISQTLGRLNLDSSQGSDTPMDDMCKSEEVPPIPIKKRSSTSLPLSRSFNDYHTPSKFPLDDPSSSVSDRKEQKGSSMLMDVDYIPPFPIPEEFEVGTNPLGPPSHYADPTPVMDFTVDPNHRENGGAQALPLSLDHPQGMGSNDGMSPRTRTKLVSTSEKKGSLYHARNDLGEALKQLNPEAVEKLAPLIPE